MTLTSCSSSTARMIWCVAPSTADVEQRHPRLQAQLAEGEVDLGHLRFFERHVVALEVGTAVGLGRAAELQELVRDVVVKLDFLGVRTAGLCRGLGQPLM